MTHLINNLATLSMSSLKRCLAVAGYWSMATIVSTLPAASALPAATQPSSGDFNELTDLAKTPQADCERCYYLYAFRLMFPIPNRYVNIGDSAQARMRFVRVTSGSTASPPGKRKDSREPVNGCRTDKVLRAFYVGCGGQE